MSDGNEDYDHANCGVEDVRNDKMVAAVGTAAANDT